MGYEEFDALGRKLMLRMSRLPEAELLALLSQAGIPAPLAEKIREMLHNPDLTTSADGPLDVPTLSPNPQDPDLSLEAKKEAFALFYRSFVKGEPPDLASLLEQRPDLVKELSEIESEWHDLDHSKDANASLARRITDRYGDIDTSPLLSDSWISNSKKPRSSPSSRVLDQLAIRSPRETRYQLQKEIGRGGMGAVLRVLDTNLQRHLAMKVMLGNAAGKDDTEKLRPEVSRFLEEAQITGQMEHPGIVPVHDLGMDREGKLYYTMPLVKGRHFGEILYMLREGKESWTIPRAVGVLLKVCQTMAYAHEKGVIHRDLKPANIMVGRFGEVYVMDWGIAKLLHTSEKPETSPAEEDSIHPQEIFRASDLTTQGQVVGTPSYMAPEQALGRLDQHGPHSDIYSAGAMLYHVLSGHRPYENPSGNRSTTPLAPDRQDPPSKLSEVAPEASVELVAICEKAMEQEPEHRFSSISALAGDLEAWLEGRVVKAYETGAVAELKKWIQRNGKLAATIMIAIFLAIAGLSGMIYLEKRAQEVEKEQRQAAEEARKRAEKATILAKEKEAEARSLLSDFVRMADVRRLSDRESEAQALWPAHPENIPKLDMWLTKSLELAKRLPGHELSLAKLRERARPFDPEAQEKEDRSRVEAFRVTELRREQAELSAIPQKTASEKNRLQTIAREIAKLRAKEEGRTSWEFENDEDQWRHDTLAGLVRELTVFSGDDPRESTIADVRRRLAFAYTVEENTLGTFDVEWEEAISSIGSRVECPSYEGLSIQPQLGLIPVGRDPDSGLWEFLHFQTHRGEIPDRDEDGKLILTEDIGLILVLIPGGNFVMGGQKNDPDQSNYDPDATPSCSPLLEVQLDPYFFSKFEMTQAQWQRFTGTNPSRYLSSSTLFRMTQPGLHPVEQVSWDLCQQTMRNLGLSLPTEAQWEYAARAGTTTRWWTGNDRESLRGAVNLADRSARKMGASWAGIEDWPDLDDGYGIHAPIGTYRPNPFGLHEIHGNVWEWAQEGYASYLQRLIRKGDGLRIESGTRSRVNRGGSFASPATSSRLCHRSSFAHAFRVSSGGVRPARMLE